MSFQRRIFETVLMCFQRRIFETVLMCFQRRILKTALTENAIGECSYSVSAKAI